MKQPEILLTTTRPYPIDVVVITNKPINEKMLSDLGETVPTGTKIVVTGLDASASANRNAGMREVETDIFVMMDDDMRGFYAGWLGDLVFPMFLNPKIMVCSARLMDESDKYGCMMGVIDHRDNRNYYEAYPSGYREYRRLPTACIAVRRNGIQFDERFIGSGFEDTAWMNEINMQFPDRGVVVNNACRLVHLHEMKNQGGKWFSANKAHYLSVYPDDVEIQRLRDYTKGAPVCRQHFFEKTKDGHVIIVERAV
jgi:hypothetical protein